MHVNMKQCLQPCGWKQITNARYLLLSISTFSSDQQLPLARHLQWSPVILRPGSQRIGSLQGGGMASASRSSPASIVYFSSRKLGSLQFTGSVTGCGVNETLVYMPVCLLKTKCLSSWCLHYSKDTDTNSVKFM